MANRFGTNCVSSIRYAFSARLAESFAWRARRLRSLFIQYPILKNAAAYDYIDSAAAGIVVMFLSRSA